ncbi:hypothetical protein AUJ17_05015 [Candidatus Micrarchaeota archaeon CG1_02_47_40]|nr:MAG: hypothetical protein AUJ17_05015 [Candidatus Micrarchaeota archaeon CG1_02_47_40]
MKYAWKNHEFLKMGSFGMVCAYSLILLLGFALTFAVVPYSGFAFHFFQLSIFISALLFGPFAGALTGALVSSYNGIFVIHNPYIILGNAILGFGAGYFAKRLGAFWAGIAAFAVQLPYLIITDFYLVHMPMAVLQNVVIALLVANVICALLASRIAPMLVPLFSAGRR